MRIGWTTGSGERARLDDGFGALARALTRRGLPVSLVDGPDATVDVIVVGAPTATFEPEGVRRWRQWAEAGGRLLVLGLPGSPPGADIGLVVPGLELAVDGTIALRGRAKITVPTGISSGYLEPRGSGWFRFGRSIDVVDVRGDDAGFRWLLLGIGRGWVGLVGDASPYADGAVATDSRPLSELLQAMLPPLHRHICALALAGDPMDLPDPSPEGMSRARTLEEGQPVSILLQPGGPVHAVRALAEAGLAEAAGDRVRLTGRGREHLPLVATLLELSSVLLRADHRGRLPP